jgi:hypothetical protein
MRDPILVMSQIQKRLPREKHIFIGNEWVKSGLQPVFDLGRLGSPMWHVYGKVFKERAKANTKVPWESKWLRP